MAALSTILTAVGVVGGLAGTAVQMVGQQRAARAQQEALAQQQQAESLRQQAMNVDAERRKREVIRQSIAARAAAVTAASSSGALQSSGLPGATGGISGQSNTNLNTIEGNQGFGNQMFGINQGILGSYRSAASGSAMATFGAGLTSLSGGILNNVGTLNRIGTYFGSSFGFNSSPGSENYAAGGIT